MVGWQAPVVTKQSALGWMSSFAVDREFSLMLAYRGAPLREKEGGYEEV